MKLTGESKFFIAIAAVTILIVVIGAFAMSKPEKTLQKSDLILADSHTQGNKNAKNYLVEFSDLQCPACRAAQPLLDEIMKTAPDSARLVYRHYPLPTIHQNAAVSARAAEAAAKQGKFWEMHDTLFDKQSDWENEKDPQVLFVAYAKELKLDETQFVKDYQNTDTDAQVQSDVADGNALGVNATPSFFVNNVKTDVSDLQATVETLLKQ